MSIVIYVFEIIGFEYDNILSILNMNNIHFLININNLNKHQIFLNFVDGDIYVDTYVLIYMLTHEYRIYLSRLFINSFM